MFTDSSTSVCSDENSAENCVNDCLTDDIAVSQNMNRMNDEGISNYQPSCSFDIKNGNDCVTFTFFYLNSTIVFCLQIIVLKLMKMMNSVSIMLILCL